MPGGLGPQLDQSARTRHPPHQLEHHLAAARRPALEVVRHRRRRSLPRPLAGFHLPADAHDRGQPVAIFVSQQPPDRRSGRCVRGGLHVAVLAADDCAGASVAETVLEEECHRQNAPDGGNREQAFAYQTFVLDFLLLAGLAAPCAGRGVFACLLAAHRSDDRLPRVHDQRGRTVAHDRRRRRWPGGQPRDRTGVLGARIADRHRRGVVRPIGPRGQGRRARWQDRHLVRRRRRAAPGTAQAAWPQRVPAAAAVFRIGLLPDGLVLQHSRRSAR